MGSLPCPQQHPMRERWLEVCLHPWAVKLVWSAMVSMRCEESDELCLGVESLLNEACVCDNEPEGNHGFDLPGGHMLKA